jgi:transposase
MSQQNAPAPICHAQAGRRRSTKARAGGQGLRRRQSAPLAKAKENQSGHSLHRLEAHPIPLDRAAYKRRNVIECMFCKLKNWRRIATRYDPFARNYLSSLALAAIIILDLIESPT